MRVKLFQLDQSKLKCSCILLTYHSIATVIKSLKPQYNRAVKLICKSSAVDLDFREEAKNHPVGHFDYIYIYKVKQM